jgi:hypothetical protein
VTNEMDVEEVRQKVGKEIKIEKDNIKETSG